jgi:two-component system CheB/CheR fusion protein
LKAFDVSATKTRQNPKSGSDATGSSSGLLLVSRDFQVLDWRGNVLNLLPQLSAGALPAKLPNGRAGSAIRLLIDGLDRGQLRADAVLDVPPGGGKPPLRLSIAPAGPKIFAILVEPVNPAAEDRIRTLEEQLKSTEEFLRTTIEEYEAATEELKCSYEELRAANEELQITTEELRDSHAAVAATRDRLEAINRNLQVQQSRLQRRFDEFVGVIHSLGLPIILLGNDLRLRFFNRAAERTFHLTAAHAGLHFRTLARTLDLETLTDTCAAVLDQLQPADRTIGNFSFHIRPLLTPENRIEGVIIRSLT